MIRDVSDAVEYAGDFALCLGGAVHPLIGSSVGYATLLVSLIVASSFGSGGAAPHPLLLHVGIRTTRLSPFVVVWTYHLAL